MCLHETENIIDDAEVHIDVCKICKKKLVYRKCRHTGRIDTRKYREEHVVDLLQRGDKLYNKYYSGDY